MIERLIEEGKAIQPKKSESTKLLYFNGSDFEKWCTKAMIYLEHYENESSIIEKLILDYENVSDSTSYNFYFRVIGALEAINKLQEEMIESF